MAKVFTADEIITLARDIGAIPDTSAQGTEDADLLKFINQYLQTTLAPAVVAAKEDYFNRSVRTTLVASTSTYRINPRAILGTLRDLNYINTDGYRSPALEQIARGNVDSLKSSSDASCPEAFWVEGNYIHLWPTLGSSAEGSIEQTFPMRPNELVLSTNTRIVSSVSSNTITLTSSVPSGWSASDTFDIHSKYSGAELKCWDKAASTVSGTSIVSTTAIDGTLTGEYAVAAGDYVCLAGECAVPAVPYEFHQVLAQAVAAKFTESLGDMENAKMHKATLDEMMQVNLTALAPRVKGKRKKVRGLPFITLQGRGRALYG